MNILRKSTQVHELHYFSINRETKILHVKAKVNSVFELDMWGIVCSLWDICHVPTSFSKESCLLLNHTVNWTLRLIQQTIHFRRALTRCRVKNICYNSNSNSILERLREMELNAIQELAFMWLFLFTLQIKLYIKIIL